MVPNPIHYATYFDRHYLTRGLALYHSLVRHSPPFQLWVLCLDDETYRTLEALRLEHVRLVPLAELERDDPALLATRPTRNIVEYYWTCGPAYLLHLFGREPHIESLTYLDADLFFFGDPRPVYDELGDGSILIIEARRSAAAQRQSISKSKFNVGLLVFRRAAPVLACLRRWRRQCLEWCYDRQEPDRVGDQKYLDDWPDRFEGVVVLRHPGVGVLPQGVDRYRFACRDGTVWVDHHPLLLYHFARLRIIAQWLYDPGLWRFENRLDPIVKRCVYAPYVRELRAAGDLVRAVGGRVAAVDTLVYSRSKVAALAQAIRHRSLLVVTDSLAL